MRGMKTEREARKPRAKKPRAAKPKVEKPQGEQPEVDLNEPEQPAPELPEVEQPEIDPLDQGPLIFGDEDEIQLDDGSDEPDPLDKGLMIDGEDEPDDAPEPDFLMISTRHKKPFRRTGMAFDAVPKRVMVDDLTADQFAMIVEEPMLIVVDGPTYETLSKQ